MSNRSGVVLALMLSILPLHAAAVESAPPKVLRLSSDVWPPFTDVPGSSRVAIDLVRAALERAKIEQNTTIRQDSTDLVDDLRSGKIDGSAALWRTDERAKFLLYSRPYLENRLVLVGKKGSDLSAVSLSLLAGKRIAVVKSYAYGQAVEKTKAPKFVEGPSDGENLQRLLRGEVDYVLADELVVHHLFRQYPEKAQRLLAVGEVPLIERSLHFAVRRDLPGAARIIQRFDAEIRAMIVDGEFNRILRVDWIRVDVDGDGVLELVHGGNAAGELPPATGYDLFEHFEVGDTKSKAGEFRYLIRGRAYDSWEDVPVEYKIPSNRDTGLEPGRPGFILFDF